MQEEVTSVVIHRPQNQTEARGVVAHLEEQGIDARLVSLRDTAYPGVVDRGRAFGEVRVSPREEEQARAAIEAWKNAIPEDLETAWQQTSLPTDSAKPAPKDPIVAALLSAAVPGLGQLYIGQFVQSLFGFVTAFVLWKTQHNWWSWLLLAGVTSVAAFLTAKALPRKSAN